MRERRKAYPFAEEFLESLEADEDDVSVEERGGELEEGEAEEGRLPERRRVAKAKDFSFEFNGEGRERLRYG